MDAAAACGGGAVAVEPALRRDVDVSDRDDVTIVECPKAHVGYVTGHKGANLRSVEQKTRTLIFTNEPPAGD